MLLIGLKRTRQDKILIIIKSNDIIQRMVRSRKDSQCKDSIWILFLLVFVMLINFLAYINLNIDNLKQLSYPTNSNGKICALQTPKTPFLYINNDFVRMCIDGCPSQWFQTNCQPTSDCKLIDSYENEQINKRYGGLCMSEDRFVAFKQHYPQLNEKQQFFNWLDMTKLITLLGVIVSLLFAVQFRYCPCTKPFVYLLIAIAFLCLFICLGYGIYGLIYKVLFSVQLSIGLIVLSSFFIIYLVFFIIFKRNCIQRSLSVLDYSKQEFMLSFWTLLWISVIFIIFTIILVFFLMLQYLAFVSSVQPNLSRQDVYYESKQIGVMQVITIIQGVVLLKFLEQLFNFWCSYLVFEKVIIQIQQDRGCLLFLKNTLAFLGSIIKSALIRTFLSPFLYIISKIKCEGDSEISQCGHCFFGYLFNLSHQYANNPYPLMLLYNLDHSCATLKTQVYLHIYHETHEKSSHQLFQTVINIVSLFLAGLSIYTYQALTFRKISELSIIICLVFYYCITSYSTKLPTIVGENIEIYLIDEQQTKEKLTKINKNIDNIQMIEN